MDHLLLSLVLIILFIPTGIKWNIKLSIVLLWVIFMILLAFLTHYILYFFWPGITIMYQLPVVLIQSIAITILVTLLFFFRDPERVPPAQEKSILSPADGTILYIREIKKGEFPFAIKGRNKIPLKEFTEDDVICENGIQIGIGMNLLNVHINRTPIAGKVIRVKRIPGKFLSLRKLQSLLENERVITIIEGDEIKAGIVQIASRLVRRIRSYVKEDDKVVKGDRMGAIFFGSQVDLLIANKNNLKIHVQKKEEVKAGLSIIATY